jgi:hypothetical protein
MLMRNEPAMNFTDAEKCAGGDFSGHTESASAKADSFQGSRAPLSNFETIAAAPVRSGAALPEIYGNWHDQADGFYE